jgi:hypothetical protein
MKGTMTYKQNLEICQAYAKMNPNNCAVRERTADGVSVGPCSYYLPDGKTCPRHGEVKGTMANYCEKCGRPYDLRENSEPTKYCDECAHDVLGKLELSRDEWKRSAIELESILISIQTPSEAADILTRFRELQTKEGK